MSIILIFFLNIFLECILVIVPFWDGSGHFALLNLAKMAGFQPDQMFAFVAVVTAGTRCLGGIWAKP